MLLEQEQLELVLLEQERELGQQKEGLQLKDLINLPDESSLTPRLMEIPQSPT